MYANDPPSLPPSFPFSPAFFSHLHVQKCALGAGRAGGGVEVETDSAAGLQVPRHALEARGLGREGGGEGGREGGKDGC